MLVEEVSFGAEAGMKTGVAKVVVGLFVAGGTWIFASDFRMDGIDRETSEVLGMVNEDGILQEGTLGFIIDMFVSLPLCIVHFAPVDDECAEHPLSH
jgi:hypothetical protein